MNLDFAINNYIVSSLVARDLFETISLDQYEKLEVDMKNRPAHRVTLDVLDEDGLDAVILDGQVDHLLGEAGHGEDAVPQLFQFLVEMSHQPNLPVR